MGYKRKSLRGCSNPEIKIDHAYERYNTFEYLKIYFKLFRNGRLQFIERCLLNEIF